MTHARRLAPIARTATRGELVAFRLSETELRTLDSLARLEGTTCTAVMRRALSQYTASGQVRAAVAGRVRDVLQPLMQQGQVSRVEEGGLFEFTAHVPYDRWTEELDEHLGELVFKLGEQVGQVIDFGVRRDPRHAERS